MNSKHIGLALCSALTLGSFSLSSQAAQWDVTITNLTHGNLFTPLLVTAHDSSTHLFQVGAAASSAIGLMAECGDLSELLMVGEAGVVDADTISNPAGGLLAAGASTTAMIDTTSNSLTVTAMVLPSNDAFVGLDAQSIPAEAGTYTYYLNAYDAGTEANDELLAVGCVAGMAGMPGGSADTGGSGGVAGADSNGNIHVHRGVLGDTDNAGGNSDIDSRIHRWQNPVAKIVVTVTP